MAQTLPGVVQAILYIGQVADHRMSLLILQPPQFADRLADILPQAGLFGANSLRNVWRPVLNLESSMAHIRSGLFPSQLICNYFPNV